MVLFRQVAGVVRFEAVQPFFDATRHAVNFRAELLDCRLHRVKLCRGHVRRAHQERGHAKHQQERHRYAFNGRTGRTFLLVDKHRPIVGRRLAWRLVQLVRLVRLVLVRLVVVRVRAHNTSHSKDTRKVSPLAGA